MPTVTIDGRAVDVERGTNLIEAGRQIGVHIPHYCYHPRLSVVGQCRMCLVEIEGMPKLQAACSVQVGKDGMVVRTDVPAVKEAQKGMMEFFLINHPLDCPICDQAGECGLQDYAFKHGQGFSRFEYEDKRTYPGRERIPLGSNVLLNMNRCIQCTRCIRFTEEIAGTGELGFFNRGARTEIGTFPGKPLDNPLATNVVDICPVGALTSTRFRFAERVWYLDKKPSICTGCDVGCNITLEHRRGKIRRYKPRFNPEVNDYWMCDFGRQTFERYGQLPRLTAPRVRTAVEGNGGSAATPVSWRSALDTAHRALSEAGGRVAVLGSGGLSNEEAFLVARIAQAAGAADRAVIAETGPERTIPNTKGGITGRETAPNRRGAELAGLGGGDAAGYLEGDAAAGCEVLVVADSDFGGGAHDPATVERLRRARTLIVLGWADTPLAAAADLALPLGTHAESGGTYVNCEWRVQRFEPSFPPPGEVLPGFGVLAGLLSRFEPDGGWEGISDAEVFDRLAAAVPAFAGLALATLPPTGAPLAVAEAAR
jgi:NADH-quinone oxidoreductase subunit G